MVPIDRIVTNLNIKEGGAVEKSATAMPSRKPVVPLIEFVLSRKPYA